MSRAPDKRWRLKPGDSVWVYCLDHGQFCEAKITYVDADWYQANILLHGEPTYAMSLRNMLERSPYEPSDVQSTQLELFS